MTTLAEYAHQHFPQHPTNSEDGRVPLAGHTVVAHVVGRQRGQRLEAAMRERLDAQRVTSLTVEPTTPTMKPEGGEDKEGIMDLPRKRVAGGAIALGVVVGIVAGIVTWLIADSPAAGIIIGVFAAIAGGWIGGVTSGGGRYAGNHAWEQQHAPDQAMVLVAVLLDDEHEANRVAAEMAPFEPEDVRILNSDGAWHSPNT